MRKIFLHFAVTLDGLVSNVEQWVSFTDEAMKDGSAWHDTVDTIIFGNNNISKGSSGADRTSIRTRRNSYGNGSRIAKDSDSVFA